MNLQQPAPEIELSVSDFVALHNQVLEYALPFVTIIGELSSFRVSKNRWVYFDLKDESASVKFFGTVYQLPGPLEDGMLVRVQGTPRVHPQFGFSITMQAIQPVGEGALKRSADLLQQQLAKEGLFDPARKRSLPYPPESIGVITSKESAAYADFMKIIAARWSGLEITVADVQVQGEAAPGQITTAIESFNQLPQPPEVLVLIRGGGSIEDLQAFSSAAVTRAVAMSRIVTLVAIGHETDTSLAELAADVRASTPSNAAELLVPDRHAEQRRRKETQRMLAQHVEAAIRHARLQLEHDTKSLQHSAGLPLERLRRDFATSTQLLRLLNPKAILQRGYAIVRDSGGNVLRMAATAAEHEQLAVEFYDGTIKTRKAEE